MSDVLITEDAVLVRGVGFRDPVDVQVIGSKLVRSPQWMVAQENGTFDEPDVEVLPAGPGYAFVTPELLEGMRDAAAEKHASIRAFVEPVLLTLPALCRLVRRKRVDEKYSWRAVARWASMRPELSRGWYPPENQIAGMLLCEVAADAFDEHYLACPWNDLPAVEAQVS